MAARMLNSSPAWFTRRRGAGSFGLLLLAGLSVCNTGCKACSGGADSAEARGGVGNTELPSESASVVPSAHTAATVAAPPPVPPSRLAHPSATYRLIGAAAEAQRALREEPRAASPVLRHVGLEQGAIRLSGLWRAEGQTTWVQLAEPEPDLWIARDSLTEVREGDGCTHAPTRRVVARFIKSLKEKRGKLLNRMVSPVRGLLFRNLSHEVQVDLSAYEIAQLFASDEKRDWGLGGAPKSFAQGVLPQLEEGLLPPAKQSCGTPLKGVYPPLETQGLVNVIYQRPRPKMGPTTWGFGVELVAGRPYVAVVWVQQ